MATTTAEAPRALDRAPIKPLGSLATAALLVAIALAIAIESPTGAPLAAVGGLGIVAVAVWMLLSERYEWSLVALMLYIGLADGYLKLRTGSQEVTLVRDLLLYAIAAGALIRLAVRREAIRWPPLSGWVVAWLIVVGIQLANPSNGTLLHSLASVRPHVEWVPLFFLGYLTIRSTRRLRAFLLILLFVAAANGVVSLVQFNLTPEQLSSWGPGYEDALRGEGSVAARTFADDQGNERTRPFALGSDFGFGGIVGLIALPAALALLALSRRPGVRLATAILSIGAVLAVATSQARVAVIAAAVAALAYAALAITSRGGLRTVIALGLAGVVVYATIGLLSADAERGSFDRYESIASPGEAVTTAYEYRRDTLSRVPGYMVEIPLGAGIGSKGPASAFGGSGPQAPYDAESEPTFLLIELGIPGLAVMLGFNLALFYLCLTRIRRIGDRETRILLTAVAAPLFALFATWFVGIATANVPGAPYLWFASGVLAFWLLGDGSSSGERAGGAPRRPAALVPEASR